MSQEPRGRPAELPFYEKALERAGVLMRPSGGTLYHYTSGQGLLGILESKGLFATDAKYFSDSSEYDYGRGLLEAEISRFDQPDLSGVSGLARDQLNQRNKSANFVACFCDDDDLVAQWRGHASDGSGYALGFDYEQLSRGGTAPLLKVLYGDEAIRAALASVIEWCISEVRRLRLERPPAMRQALLDLLTATITTLFMLIVASKKNVFRHEQEWRLVAPRYAMDDLPAEQLGFRVVGDLLVPHIVVPLPRRADGNVQVLSVRCGPARLEERRLDGVRAKLAQVGIDDVPVTASEAPLRR